MIFRYLKKLSRKNKKLFYGFCLLLNDLIFLIFSFYLSYFIRFYKSFLKISVPTYYIDKNYIFYSLIFIILTIIFFAFYRLYDWDKLFRGSGYYFRIFKAISINIIIIIIFGYLLETFSFSRIWITLLYLFSLALIMVSRFIIENISRYIIKKIGLSSKTIIIGLGEDGKRIYKTLNNYKVENYEIIGFIDKEEKIQKIFRNNKEHFILGYLENLNEIIKKSRAEKVIILSNEFNYEEILNMLDELKSTNVMVLMFPGFFELSAKRMQMREIGGIPLIQLANIGFSGLNLFYKKIIDYILGIIIFIFFIPIYLIIGLIIKMDSRGPVFYKQIRYTNNFKKFEMYKFRTMYLDAEKKLEELKDKNITRGPIFKMRDDPRITRVGKFLRKYSIDEIPQIINVLKGNLSLVGPRPPIPSEVEKYEGWHKKRLNVKQGVTGLWQTSGRSDLNFEEMVRLDLYYIQNWSIGLDIKIILKTIPVILFGKGAY